MVGERVGLEVAARWYICQAAVEPGTVRSSTRLCAGGERGDRADGLGALVQPLAVPMSLLSKGARGI